MGKEGCDLKKRLFAVYSRDELLVSKKWVD